MSRTTRHSGADDAWSRRLLDAAAGHRRILFGDLHDSAQALLALRLRDLLQSSVVWVTDGERALDTFMRNLTALDEAETDGQRLYVPAREIGRSDPAHVSDRTGRRIDALKALHAARSPAVVGTHIQALMQSVIEPDRLNRQLLRLDTGAVIDPDELCERLSGQGYVFEPEVQDRGQASRRGGIVDCWPAHEALPCRIEFFGDTVESIRRFDPLDQTSVETLEAADLPPAGEPRGQASLMDYLPPDTLWIMVRPAELEAHAALFEAVSGEAHQPVDYTLHEILAEADRRFERGWWALGESGDAGGDAEPVDSGLEPVPALPAPMLESGEPEALRDLRREMTIEWNRQADEGFDVRVFLNTEGMKERFEEECREWLGSRHALTIRVGGLTEGFIAKDARLSCLAESDLYGHRKTVPGWTEQRRRKERARFRKGESIREWTDIQPGDLVVHVNHGIGRYLGLYEIQVNRRLQEVLTIEYADGAKLHVPVTQAHVLSRYIGMSRKAPRLHRLGGRRWKNDKEKAVDAVRDLAAELLQTQAERDVLKGHAFAPDTLWQHEFEASFPYEETADQHTALEQVKHDMESDRPMDRLICGDVGYGKTEVAMRAAFKAVMDGFQVAVLVPTTILAQQHYETFKERMSAFPIRVEMLSRFVSRGRQNALIEALKKGAVDIVIGTHRLVQADVGFDRLGLLIIDEEQRFGVEHKEALKGVRRLVDVLTLTATPIPRTLYLSLSGARDMSTIQTPPRERVPIETLVTAFDEGLIREVILRELNREGQVFFLHNRVQTIERMAERLRELVPEARLAVGHGQMSEKELADVMHRFTRGAVDILLCTTIIESGVDIPNVNTILIDRADRFGLADLYQLRGRVGRQDRKAYAYLLLPRHGRLFDTARKRIQALRSYSSLGAGFKLALRDLEIRGAGNLLGAEQSGHIAAVGFDLYCQLLNRTVAGLKNKKPPPLVTADMRVDFIDAAPTARDADQAAAIPYTYIDDETLRVRLYRELAATARDRDVLALRRAWRDRFGPLPRAVECLLLLRRCRIEASRKGFDRLEVRDDKVILSRADRYAMQNGRFPRLKSGNALDRLKALLRQVKATPAIPRPS